MVQSYNHKRVQENKRTWVKKNKSNREYKYSIKRVQEHKRSRVQEYKSTIV